VLLDRQRLQRENDTQRIELSATRTALDALQQKHRALEVSVIGRASKAGQSAALLFDVLSAYFDHIHTRTGRDNARKHVFMATAFVVSLPESVRTIADVEATQVETFLDSESAKAPGNKRKSRRHKTRQLIGSFVTWACKQCGMPTLMTAVTAASKNEVLRERGDIHWHSLEEVKSVIEGLEKPYWKTLVSTLAYAGLQLAELVWLRTNDLEWLPDGGAQLWVTTVADPDNAAGGHQIKAENRRRHVRLHPKLLQPLIREHVDAGRAGTIFLFPMPNGVQRRKRRVTGGTSERWQTVTLSTILRGHKGGKKRKPVDGLLPPGMHAKSLRRTFGSLLLRSGKSTAEVAAAMGNDESMVKSHYARLKGCEISMNF